MSKPLELQTVALRAANVADASVLLAGSAPAALGSSLHDELRVVGKTLFHCDLAQQIILARYKVQEGTTVGAGGSAAFANFSTGGVVTRGLCIVRDRGRRLSVFMPSSGECHELPLPFQGQHAQAVAPTLWPLDLGVALAYDTPPIARPDQPASHSGGLNPPSSGGASMDQGHASTWELDEEDSAEPPAVSQSPLALLYTLTHPLDEPRPVHLVGDTPTPFNHREASGAHHAGREQVLWVHRHPGWPLAIAVTRTVLDVPATTNDDGGEVGSEGSGSVAATRRLGRRAVWALRRCGAEGFEGDRYDPKSPAHRSRAGGVAWRSGRLYSTTTMNDQTGGDGGRGGCGPTTRSGGMTPMRKSGQQQLQQPQQQPGHTTRRFTTTTSKVVAGEDDPVIGLATDSIVMELQHESLLSSLRRTEDSSSASSLPSHTVYGGLGFGATSSRSMFGSSSGAGGSGQLNDHLNAPVTGSPFGDPTSAVTTTHRWGSTLRSSGALGGSFSTSTSLLGDHGLSNNRSNNSSFNLRGTNPLALPSSPPSKNPPPVSPPLSAGSPLVGQSPIRGGESSAGGGGGSARRVSFSRSGPIMSSSNSSSRQRSSRDTSNNNDSSLSIGGETPVASRKQGGGGLGRGHCEESDEFMLLSPVASAHADDDDDDNDGRLMHDDDDDTSINDSLLGNRSRKHHKQGGSRSIVDDSYEAADLPHLNVVSSPTKKKQRQRMMRMLKPGQHFQGGGEDGKDGGGEEEEEEEVEDEMHCSLPVPQFALECAWWEDEEEVGEEAGGFAGEDVSDDDVVATAALYTNPTAGANLEPPAAAAATRKGESSNAKKQQRPPGVSVGERVLLIDTPPDDGEDGSSSSSAEQHLQRNATLCFVDPETGALSALGLEFFNRRTGPTRSRSNSDGSCGNTVHNNRSRCEDDDDDRMEATLRAHYHERVGLEGAPLSSTATRDVLTQRRRQREGVDHESAFVRVRTSYDLSRKLLLKGPSYSTSPALAALSFEFTPLAPSSSSSSSALSSAAVVDVPFPHSGLHAAPTFVALDAHARAKAAEAAVGVTAASASAAAGATSAFGGPSVITGDRGALPRSRSLLVLLPGSNNNGSNIPNIASASLPPPVAPSSSSWNGEIVLSDASGFACAACVVISSSALAYARESAHAGRKDGFVESSVLEAALCDAADDGCGQTTAVKLKAVGLLSSAGDFVDVLCKPDDDEAEDEGEEKDKPRTLFVARVKVSLASSGGPGANGLLMDVLAVADSVLSAGGQSGGGQSGGGGNVGSVSLSLRADAAERAQRNRREALSAVAAASGGGDGDAEAGLAKALVAEKAMSTGTGGEWLALLEVLLERFSTTTTAPSHAAGNQPCATPADEKEVAPPSAAAAVAPTDDGAWARLLGSSFHASFEQQHGGLFDGIAGSGKFSPPLSLISSPSTTSSTAPQPKAAGGLWGRREALELLLGLHLLYEDRKLTSASQGGASSSASLTQALEALAHALQMHEYEEHYRRDRGAPMPLQEGGAWCEIEEDGSGGPPVPEPLRALAALRFEPRPKEKSRAFEDSGEAAGAATASGQAMDTDDRGNGGGCSIPDEPTLPVHPPCVRTHLLTLLQIALDPSSSSSASSHSHSCQTPFPTLNDGCYMLSRTAQVCTVYGAMAANTASANFASPSSSSSSSLSSSSSAQSRFLSCMAAGVEAMVSVGLTARDLVSLPHGIALPLQHCLRVCRLHPPPVWSAAAFALCGRPDLALLLPKAVGSLTRIEKSGRSSHANEKHKSGTKEGVPQGGQDEEKNPHIGSRQSGAAASSFMMSGRSDVADVAVDAMATFPSAAELSGSLDEGTGGEGEVSNARGGGGGWVSEMDGHVRRADKDGLMALEAMTEVRFSSDLRVREVCRLLSSAKPHYLSVPRPPEASDMHYIHLQHAKLLLLATRALAATVGRGALTLGTLKPKAALAEPLPIPNLSLNGRTPPRDTTIRLDLNASSAAVAAAAGTAGGPTLAAAAAAAAGLPAPLTESMLLVWPAFHNGVAAGLRLAPAPPPPPRGNEQHQGGEGGAVHNFYGAQASGSGGAGGWGGAVGYGGGNSGSSSMAASVGGGEDSSSAGAHSPSSFLSWPVTRNWIAYNGTHLGVGGGGGGAAAAAGAEAAAASTTPPENTANVATRAAYGGMLMALGMHRHLGSLQKPDLYRYLKEGHEPTAVGLLLGMGCQHRGTANADANIVIRMHIPHTYDYGGNAQLGASVSTEVAPATQAAAVAALGLLYMGTNNRQISDFLLNEMGRRPSSERCDDREAYSLSAGLALGLVTLGAGASGGTAGQQSNSKNNAEDKNNGDSGTNGGGGAGESDYGGGRPHRGGDEDDERRGRGGGESGSQGVDHGGGGRAGLTANMLLEQRLHRFIAGGRDNLGGGVGAAGHSSSVGGAGGGAGGAGGLAAGGGAAGGAGGGGGGIGGEVAPNRSSKVSDGEFINTNVTAPGATLALALCFLKSNDRSVAARLALPDTHPLLDYCRPDQLLLRVFARALILWDSVEVSTEWVMAQVPDMVKEAWNVLGTSEGAHFGKAFAFNRGPGGGNKGGENGGSGGGNGEEDEDDENDDDELDLSGLSDLLEPLSDHKDDDGGEDDVKETEVVNARDAEDGGSPEGRAGMCDDDDNDDEGGDSGDDNGEASETGRLPTRRDLEFVEVAAAVAAAEAVQHEQQQGVGGASSAPSSARVDVSSVRNAHANCIAGALLGLGLRYAGTAHPAAFETVKFFAEHFKALRDGKPNPSVAIGKHGCGPEPPPPPVHSNSSGDNDDDGEGKDSGGGAAAAGFMMFGAMASAKAMAAQKFGAQKPDRVTLETCVGCAALSIGCIMAGTGDLAALRLLRELRFKVDPDVTYGNQMAIHLSLGLLFLGGGSLTLGRDLPQLACLVMAVFPRSPVHAHDNQYHLQPLRHLYVLAAEPRSFMVVDVDTQRPVFMPIEIEVEVNGTGAQQQEHQNHGDEGAITPLQPSPSPFRTEVLSLVAPCLVSCEISSVVRLTVNSPRYFPLTLRPREHPEHMAALRSFKILVKRKLGHLSYARDPHGLHSVATTAAQSSSSSSSSSSPSSSSSSSLSVSSKQPLHLSLAVNALTTSISSSYYRNSGGALSATGGGGGASSSSSDSVRSHARRGLALAAASLTEDPSVAALAHHLAGLSPFHAASVGTGGGGLGDGGGGGEDRGFGFGQGLVLSSLGVSTARSTSTSSPPPPSSLLHSLAFSGLCGEALLSCVPSANLDALESLLPLAPWRQRLFLAPATPTPFSSSPAQALAVLPSGCDLSPRSVWNLRMMCVLVNALGATEAHLASECESHSGVGERNGSSNGQEFSPSPFLLLPSDVVHALPPHCVAEAERSLAGLFASFGFAREDLSLLELSSSPPTVLNGVSPLGHYLRTGHFAYPAAIFHQHRTGDAKDPNQDELEAKSRVAYSKALSAYLVFNGFPSPLRLRPFLAIGTSSDCIRKVSLVRLARELPLGTPLATLVAIRKELQRGL